MLRSPLQAQSTPDTNMTTPPPKFYTPSEYEEIIPETQLDMEENNKQHTDLKQALIDAIAEANKLNVQGKNRDVKTNILACLHEAASIAQTLASKPTTVNLRNSDIYDESNKLQSDNFRFTNLERDMNTMKDSMTELKELMQEMAKPGPRTYAQTTATKPETSTKPNNILQERIRIQKEKERTERKQYEVMLSNDKVSDETKTEIANKRPKDLITSLQDTIEKTVKGEKPAIQAVNKFPNGIRIQCKTIEDAKQLKLIDWNRAYEGLSLRIEKYGVVIHGVPKTEINTESTNQDNIISKIKEANTWTKETPRSSK
jgi:hypothetical protein